MVRAPLAWYDSVSAGPGGGGSAVGAPLLALRGWSRSPGRDATRGVFGYRSGSFASEGASLLLQRGDSARWAEVDLASWSRGEVAALGPAGRHRWGFAGGWRGGGHRLDGAFAQRGAASRLRSFEEQSARGESGELSWSWQREGRSLALTVARAWDGRESVGPLLIPSRRDGDAVSAELRGARPLGGGAVEARLGASGARVRRSGDPSFDQTADIQWCGVTFRRDLGDGTLVADLAAARHEVDDRRGTLDTLAWERRRVIATPDVAYRFDQHGLYGGVRIGRRATPVWSDLAPGEAPFLQDGWVYGLEAGARHPGGSHLGGALLMGRIDGRAILFRLPLDELWLRLGAVRDPKRSEFALATASGEWRLAAFRVGGDAFALSRDRDPVQPRVDPAGGFRGWLESRWRMFQGDLGVAVRADAAGIAERESESVTPVLLPGYVTFGATVRLELGDALVVVRARNLEGRRRFQPWIDLVTGREALGPGFALETSLTWLLFN